MPSALELSVQFGIPARKIEALCECINYPLSSEDFDSDKHFENAARSVKRKRASAGTMAYLYNFASDVQRDFILDLDESFADEYRALDLPIAPGELLSDASALITRLEQDIKGDDEPWLKIAQWVKLRIQEAGKPIGHAYIAVRLLSSLDKSSYGGMPAIVARILNRLRHRKFLDGWFTLDEQANGNTVIYHKPNMGAVPDIGLSMDDIDAFAMRLGSREIGALASFIAFEKKLKLADVTKFLQKALASLDL